jgi:hypothetical protein
VPNYWLIVTYGFFLIGVVACLVYVAKSFEDDDLNAVEVLNEAGAQGWELVESLRCFVSRFDVLGAGSEPAFLDGRQLSHFHVDRQGEDSSLWLFVGKRREMTWLAV